MYDYNLELPDVTAYKNAFVEAMTKEQPDIDKMSAAFEAVAAAFDDVSQQATALDMVREQAKSRIFNLNEMLNKRMNEIISNKPESDPEDAKEAFDKNKRAALDEFFGIDRG